MSSNPSPAARRTAVRDAVDRQRRAREPRGKSAKSRRRRACSRCGKRSNAAPIARARASCAFRINILVKALLSAGVGDCPSDVGIAQPSSRIVNSIARRL
jgi:hypothetical protein